ncbi:MAG: serine hydrolase [Lachnospiraceae bacterium]
MKRVFFLSVLFLLLVGCARDEKTPVSSISESTSAKEDFVQDNIQTQEETKEYTVEEKAAVSAKAYCVMDGDTGEIFMSYNGKMSYAPASITKVVTALAVVNHCEDLDEQVVITDEMYEDVALLSSTVHPALRVGEVLTVRDLLYGMVLCSGNECASALAVYTAGSVEAFTVWMNELAEQVGADGCHFVNAHGLDQENHVVSAEGICKLWRAALENDTVRELFSAVSYSIPATNLVASRELTSTNQFLNGSQSLEGVYAGKTGFTFNAGYTLLTAVELNDKNILVAVLGCDSGKNYDDTRFLLNTIVGDVPYGNVYGSYVKAMNTDSFVVSAQVSSQVSVGSIAYWTEENGQDDIVWLNDVAIENGCMEAEISAGAGLYKVALIGKDEKETTLSQEIITVLMSGEQQPVGSYIWNDRQWRILRNGTCALGWYEDNTNYCYAGTDGLFETGIFTLGSTSYYFENYQMQSGWVNWEGNTYYALPCGDLVTGKILIDGVWKEFDESGRLKNAEVQSN